MHTSEAWDGQRTSGDKRSKSFSYIHVPENQAKGLHVSILLTVNSTQLYTGQKGSTWSDIGTFKEAKPSNRISRLYELQRLFKEAKKQRADGKPRRALRNHLTT